jgi:hypothetical protein
MPARIQEITNDLNRDSISMSLALASGGQVVVLGRQGHFDGRRAQLYFDFPLGPAFITGLNQPVVGSARVGDPPVVRVISEKRHYVHFLSSLFLDSLDVNLMGKDSIFCHTLPGFPLYSLASGRSL